MRQHNLIQRPEVLLRLARALGMRQAHVTPALNEGLQPVVIVDDLTTRHKAPYHTYSAAFQSVAGVGKASAISLINPAASGVQLRMRWIEYFETTSVSSLWWRTADLSDTAPVLMGHGIRHTDPVALATASMDSRALLYRSLDPFPLAGSNQLWLLDSNQIPQRVWFDQIIIPPGFGLIQISGVVNSYVYAGFCWDEETLGEMTEPIG